MALLLSAISTQAQFTLPQRGSVASITTGPSAFTYVAGSATGCYNVNSATSCSYNLHVNPTAGNLGLIMLEWQSTSTPTFACTNNASWTPIGSAKAGVGANIGFTGQMFYIPSLAAGAAPENCAITISPAAGFLMWEYAEYSYSGTISSLDGTPQYSTTPAVASVATISGVTTVHSSDLVWATCIGAADHCTVGAGYTSRNDTNACRDGTGGGNCSGGTTSHNFTSDIGSLIEEKVNVGPGAQTATFGTTNATDDVILGLVAF